MSVLGPLISNLKNLKAHIEATLDAQVSQNLNEFESMERERLEKGINNEGDKLTREGADYYPYTPAYSRYKRAKGGQVNVVDLNLTGNYTREITATRKNKNTVTMSSKDSKDRFLSKQYPGTHGLSPDQREEVTKMFTPEIIKAVRAKVTNR